MNKRYLGLITDSAMFFAIAMLNATLFTGLAWHETIGLLFIVPLFAHLIRSWKIIQQSMRSFKQPKLSWRKLNFILSTCLYILCVLEIASGLMISHVLIPLTGLNTFNDWKWRGIHNGVSVGIFIVVSIHVAVHWSKIVSYFIKKTEARRFFKRTVSLSTIPAMLNKILVLLLIAILVVSIAVLIIGLPNIGSGNASDNFANIHQNIVSGSVQLAGAILALVLLSALVRQLLKLGI